MKEGLSKVHDGRYGGREREAVNQVWTLHQATEAEEESRVIELVIKTLKTRFKHRIGRPKHQCP
jgi:hypothetical protein